MLRLKHKIVALILAVIITVAMGVGSFAQVGGGTYQTVKYTGQVVDTITFNSVKVNAIYSLGGGYGNNEYSCAALVMRFYKQVYRFDVWNLSSSYSTPVCSNGKTFSKTNKPRVGDIVRFQDRTHWALVKAVSGNTVTIIEQNWAFYSSSGYTAAVNRTVNVGDAQVSFFTYSGYLNKLEKPQAEEEIIYDSFEEAVAVGLNKQQFFIENEDNLKVSHETQQIKQMLSSNIKSANFIK